MAGGSVLAASDARRDFRKGGEISGEYVGPMDSCYGPRTKVAVSVAL